jgi:hypothetical protein
MKERPPSDVSAKADALRRRSSHPLASHPIVASAFAPGATEEDRAAAMRLLLAYQAVGPKPDASAIRAVFRRSVPPGALVVFIVRRAQRYVEPERQGTPRGDPIGFSAAKYRASLLTMTRLSLRDVSRATGVSYGVLAKWKTERDFVRQVNSHIVDVITIDWNAVLVQNALQYEKDLESLLSLPRTEADAAIRTFSPSLVDVGDYALYGGELLRALFARMEAHLAAQRGSSKEASDPGTVNIALAFEGYLHREIFVPMLLGERSLKKLGRSTRKQVLDAVAAVELALCEATMGPEDQRRMALLALGTVRRIAERLDT